MTVAKYLSNIFLEQESVMMSNFIYVVFTVLTITIKMFSLKNIFQDSFTPKIRQYIFKTSYLKEINLLKPAFLSRRFYFF